eukprot:1144588-Pelagomonas_calceolata.AAC.3
MHSPAPGRKHKPRALRVLASEILGLDIQMSGCVPGWVVDACACMCFLFHPRSCVHVTVHSALKLTMTVHHSKAIEQQCAALWQATLVQGKKQCSVSCSPEGNYLPAGVSVCNAADH